MSVSDRDNFDRNENLPRSLTAGFVPVGTRCQPGDKNSSDIESNTSVLESIIIYIILSGKSMSAIDYEEISGGREKPWALSAVTRQWSDKMTREILDD